MKFIIFFALLAFAAAQEHSADQKSDEVVVLEDIREGPIGADFNNHLDLSDNTVVISVGSQREDGVFKIEGSYSFELDGISYRVTYVADDNGFQAEGDHLPVDHPLPEHVHELLKIAEQQRAEGIQFDDQGFQI